MKVKALFIFACLGILSGIVSVFIYNEKSHLQAPGAISYNPYPSGIYGNGIIESDLPSGSNINIYPEVPGKVLKVFVQDGQKVKALSPLLLLDSSVQEKMVEKDKAQVIFNQNNVSNTQAQYQKIFRAHKIYPSAVTIDALDTAKYTAEMAKANLDTAIAQLEIDQRLLDKYTLKAPIDGIILQLLPAVGDYISPSGIYNTYTQSMSPIAQIGSDSPYWNVRCYVDEILISRLPETKKMQAKLFIRGENNHSIPLEFVRIQPYTIPNIQLSNNRTERVDVRVLPVIFRFKKPSGSRLYPGQLVDVYIESK